MSENRLSPLDASFLEVETPSAHMHVGWAALFARPREGETPSFEAFRQHIDARLASAPRYRQKLAEVPLGLNDPVWVDDEDFDLGRHVRRSERSDWHAAVDTVMSEPLDRSRPLWELWINDRLDDGRIGVIGKAHHCMVDGIAAVELASLMLDPTPEPPAPVKDDWRPKPAPSALTLLAGGFADRLGQGLELARAPIGLTRRPERLLELGRAGIRVGRAAIHSFRPAKPEAVLNEPSSPLRHLAAQPRRFDELSRIRKRFKTTINDVELAVAAGGLRRFLARRGNEPQKLKTMVPVSVREGDASELGNRISFVFIDLPCDEPDAVRRLMDVHLAMDERKQAGEPEGADTLLKAVGYAPRTLQHAVSRVVASPQTFNLVVSNIPGPREPLYMLGCELQEAYPVVPLADQHALSIALTTIRDRACFSVYADREAVPDADALAEDIDESIEELLALT